MHGPAAGFCLPAAPLPDLLLLLLLRHAAVSWQLLLGAPAAAMHMHPL
jgi:hypothetical protein